jgi:peptide/nickel transport system substrate-binding protein
MSLSNYRKKISERVERVLVLYKSLTPERVLLFWVLASVSIALFFLALLVFNSKFLITVPTYGGKIHEGIIGTPRFINPILATSDQDKDLVDLVYAGLTKRDTDGRIILDIAESITESDDKLQYTVVLKEDAEFHDGVALTSDDVLYTVALIQNPNIKSPHKVEWEGVEVEKQSDTELVFSLKKPFPFFMNTLTIGILPKHIWKDLTDEQFSLSDYNIHAIGAGPYAIDDIQTKSGIPTTLVLKTHQKYTLGRPYVDTIVIETYQNEKYAIQAFIDGDVDRIHGIPPEKVSTLNVATSSVHTALLPRTFTVFFNPNKERALSDKQVRLALSMAINKEAIVRDVLLNYGKVIDTPYPFDEDVPQSTYNVEEAKSILAKSPTFKKASSTLTLTLSTANIDEMKRVGEMIKNDWEAIGVKTTLVVYEVADLNQSVIKERDFQVLLFASITQNPSDLYAFWHSTQRSYPGLNISNYVSKRLDTNLETLRTSEDELARIGAYEAVKKEFAEETPGIFLFAPSLIYITNDKVHTFLPKYIADSSSRFVLVHDWYRYAEKVWPRTYYKQAIETLQNIFH